MLELSVTGPRVRATADPLGKGVMTLLPQEERLSVAPGPAGNAAAKHPVFSSAAGDR